MNGLYRNCITTMHCWRLRNEGTSAVARSGEREAVLQGAQDAGDRSQLRASLRAGGEGETEPYRIFGSIASDGIGGAGPARNPAPDSRCEVAAREDAGGVRFFASVAD